MAEHRGTAQPRCECENPSLHDPNCAYLLACAPYGRCSKCSKALTLPAIWPGMVGPSYCGDCSKPAPPSSDAFTCALCHGTGASVSEIRHALGCPYDRPRPNDEAAPAPMGTCAPAHLFVLHVGDRVRVTGGAWESSVGKLATVEHVYPLADDGSQVVRIVVDGEAGTLSLAASDVEHVYVPASDYEAGLATAERIVRRLALHHQRQRRGEIAEAVYDAADHVGSAVFTHPQQRPNEPCPRCSVEAVEPGDLICRSCISAELGHLEHKHGVLNVAGALVGAASSDAPVTCIEASPDGVVTQPDDDAYTFQPGDDVLVRGRILRHDQGDEIYLVRFDASGAVSRSEVWVDPELFELGAPSAQQRPESTSNEAKPDVWVDTRLVRFDDTIVFGHGGFDFDAWESLRWEMHTPHGSWAVWKSGRRWSMYGGPLGHLALDAYASEREAREDAESIALSQAQFAALQRPNEAMPATGRAAYADGWNEALNEAAKTARGHEEWANDPGRLTEEERRLIVGASQVIAREIESLAKHRPEPNEAERAALTADSDAPFSTLSERGLDDLTGELAAEPCSVRRLAVMTLIAEVRYLRKKATAQRTEPPVHPVHSTVDDWSRAAKWIDDAGDAGVIGHYREPDARRMLAELIAEVRAEALPYRDALETHLKLCRERTFVDEMSIRAEERAACVAHVRRERDKAQRRLDERRGEDSYSIGVRDALDVLAIELEAQEGGSSPDTSSNEGTITVSQEDYRKVCWNLDGVSGALIDARDVVVCDDDYSKSIRELTAQRDAARAELAKVKDDVPALRKVAEVARELVGWDWLHLLDDTVHSRDVRVDVERLREALAELDGGTK